MTQFFASGGQSIGVSASVSACFSISPSNEYSGQISFRTDWISLQSKGLSRVFSNTTVQKHQFFGTQLSFRFLPYINMNQPCPLPLEHPSHLSPPIPSHPSRLSQNMGLSSLSHTANFHRVSALHMGVYMLPRHSIHLSHPLLPPLPQLCA